jgi:hypothetical protein
MQSCLSPPEEFRLGRASWTEKMAFCAAAIDERIPKPLTDCGPKGVVEPDPPSRIIEETGEFNL